MWKLVSGLSLALCTVTVADDTLPKESVMVQCCGRLRHGVVAIGGETTGTTMTVNRIIWEVKLHNEAEREFANEHNKETVVVTGRLRKISGIETKTRWIIDVSKMSERNVTTHKEGIGMTIQGTLRTTNPRNGDPEMIISSDGQVWPIDVSSDARLNGLAESLVGQPILLTGSLEQDTEDDSNPPPVIHVKTLKRSVSVAIQHRGD